MHKRAFHTYKEFEFLKAGVLTRKDELENKQNPMAVKRLSEEMTDEFEPFNYPPLKDTVAKVFTKGIQPKIGDPGDNSMLNL